MALHPVDNVWHRGIVRGYADDWLDKVLVELVDLSVVEVVDRGSVKQLSYEYSNVRLGNRVSFVVIDFDLFFTRFVFSVAASVDDGASDASHSLEAAQT